MMVCRAAWVCPIARAPIRNGWVAIDNGRIAAVGNPGEACPSGARDLGEVVVMPALVNAHTHLELSWLRGRVPPANHFVDWVKQLFMTRGGRSERPDDVTVTGAAGEAAREMRACGTGAVGDISNSLASIEPIRDAGLKGLVFHELLGFNLPHGRSVVDTRPLRAAAAARGGDAVRVTVAPHAPYSVSPEMFRAIREELDRSPVSITSVHLGESTSEIEFLRDGSGSWPTMLKWVGSERPDWVAPGVGPVEYLDALEVLDERTLIVHGVQLDDSALRRLATLGCTLVTCPRSNQWVGAGAPPVGRFYASGVKVAVGTDSLASVDDLNLFAELKVMRWLAPDVPARELLASATRVGAEALGLGHELGTIEVGKRAALIAVALPPELRLGPSAENRLESRGTGPLDSQRARPSGRTSDIEEYLVNGIEARQVTWVSS
jgi:cytosine/adenosine deaminase-related metal-dependent hydrolase